jgi:hypothetical protein
METRWRRKEKAVYLFNEPCVANVEDEDEKDIVEKHVWCRGT